MLYRRLTTQEFENLAEDFALFLASNSVDKKEWDQIKESDTKKAEDMLDIFSDMVFEKALSSCKYLERLSEKEINAYLFQENQAHLITIKIKEGFEGSFIDGTLSQTFIHLLKEKGLDVYQATRAFTEKREVEMFEAMQKGAQFSKGDLYNSLLSLL